LRDLAAPSNGHPHNGHAAGGGFNVVAQYPYRDESGALIFQTVRLDPKDFRQRKPKEGGGWDWKTKDCRKVLYRLPELIAAPATEFVFVCEGEKDCDNAAAKGLVATCNVGGAGKWRNEYNEHLRGRHVVVLADKDKAGRDHAEKVATALQLVALDVKVIELPGDGVKDISDWLAAGGTKEQLLEIVAAAPVHVSTKSSRTKRAAKPEDVGNPSAAGIPLIRTDAGRTDLANGRRFRAMHGADALYVTDWGRWIVWDDRRYAEDAGPLMEAKAKRVAEVLFLSAAEALALSDRTTMDAILSFCRYSSGSRGIANTVTMARSEPGVGVTTAQLDSDPWLLNLPNGTLELKTITLRPHSQSDRLTKLCPTPYDPDADCPLWRGMVATITDHNEVLQRFLRRLAGYWLTGLVREHILPIFWGEGANGKSTYLGALLGMMGRDYAMKAAKDFLTIRSGEVHPTEQADLYGKRLAVAIETENGKSLAESLVKELTGADDIRARKMRQDFWQFGPTHKLVLATNHKPLLRGTDHAIWRRLKLTPFTVTIPDDEQDKSLPEKLKAEASGILNWCLLGLQEYMADGLGEPSEVTEATAGYRVEMDVFGKFFGDCCLVGNGYSCRASDLYKHYHAWCEANGEHSVSGRRFGMGMTEKGFERKTNNGVWYLGIGLLGDRPLTEGTE
jgi:putative DNA primase/helicase